MDLGPLRTLALDLNFSAHGVAATVTRPAPDDDPIVTTAIWVTPTTNPLPAGLALQRHDQRRVLALKRADVPTVPTKTLIVAPPKAGDADQTWRVDGTDRVEPDHVRVTVQPVAE